MATQTLTWRHADASVATPVPIEALAGGKPSTPVILALDLGQKTGSALRNHDGRLPVAWRSFARDGSRGA